MIILVAKLGEQFSKKFISSHQREHWNDWKNIGKEWLVQRRLTSCSHYIKKEVSCQEWDSNPRLQEKTATWTQRLRPLGHPADLHVNLKLNQLWMWLDERSQYFWGSPLSNSIIWPPCYCDLFFSLKKWLFVNHCGMSRTRLIRTTLSL